MTGAPPLRAGRRRSWAALGWILVLVSLAYAGVIHHGVGATGRGPIAHWWQPRGLFFTWESFDSLLADPTLATIVLGLPAFALAVAIAATTRSALATTLGLAAAGLVLLCCFYGLGDGRRAVWGFFGWRGSSVMALFSLALAAAVLAPLFARRWLALGWPARILVYTPVALAVMLAIRDVTGTDPALPFAISPWPVVSMFGIEIGDAGIAALLAMLGLDLAAAGLLAQRRLPSGLACALLSLLIPVGIFGLGLGLGTGLLALVVACAAVSLWLARNDGGDAPGGASRLLRGARSTTIGATLVALPILGGQLLVAHDYDVTRNRQAKQILDALDAYYARVSVYPDSLADLVASKDLAAVPDPQIGFGVFEAPRFTYQSFGTNYLLEFSAPRWVQCAYNPPYPDDDGGASLGTIGGGDAAAADPGAGAPADEPAGPFDARAAEAAAPPEGGEPGSWSCPQKPPELW